MVKRHLFHSISQSESAVTSKLLSIAAHGGQHIVAGRLSSLSYKEQTITVYICRQFKISERSADQRAKNPIRQKGKKSF